MGDSDLLNGHMALTQYGVGRTAVWHAIKAGKLPAVLVGRSYVFTRADFESWLRTDYKPDKAQRYLSRVTLPAEAAPEGEAEGEKQTSERNQ